MNIPEEVMDAIVIRALPLIDALMQGAPDGQQ